MAPKNIVDRNPGPANLIWQSYFLPIPGGAQLHLKRIHNGQDGPPVFMVHGSIENGKIFYSDTGKGLGPWLAQEGYDVFVADLQGRGSSRPLINRHSRHGLEELTQIELPAFLKQIHAIKGPRPMHWIAHSWGGVDLLSYLAKPNYQAEVKNMVFFGSKRRISIRSLRYHWMIGVGWNKLARLSIWRRGYLDAIAYRLGADNISAQTFYDTDMWIRSKEWIHPHTGMDYSKALQGLDLPPTLYLAGKSDHVLGHPTDVQLLAQETGPDHRYCFHVLGKANGHKHDYGHVDMLTHRDAPQDVFPIVKDWMEGKRSVP
jgi:predicted alpha/beta hydrolase